MILRSAIYHTCTLPRRFYVKKDNCTISLVSNLYCNSSFIYFLSPHVVITIGKLNIVSLQTSKTLIKDKMLLYEFIQFQFAKFSHTIITLSALRKPRHPISNIPSSCAANSAKKYSTKVSHEITYLSNRPQVYMGYRLINHAGCW